MLHNGPACLTTTTATVTTGTNTPLTTTFTVPNPSLPYIHKHTRTQLWLPMPTYHTILFAHKHSPSYTYDTFYKIVFGNYYKSARYPITNKIEPYIILGKKILVI